MDILDLAALTHMPMSWAQDPNNFWALKGWSYISPFAMVDYAEYDQLEHAIVTGSHYHGNQWP